MKEGNNKFPNQILTTNPPYGAEVVLDDICIGNGWNAPIISKSLDESINQASLVRILL